MQPELQWPCQELPGHPSLSQKQLYPTNKWNNGTNAATKLEPKPNMTKKPMKTQGEQPTPQHCPGERHERFQHNTAVLFHRCTKLYKQCINSKHQCAASLQLVNFILWRCPSPIVAKQQQIRPNKGSSNVTYEQCCTLSLANRMVSASILHKHPQCSINRNAGLSHSTTGNFLEAWVQP